MVAFPLEELSSWKNVGDTLVEALNADVATLGPGVWYPPRNIFIGSYDLTHAPQPLSELFATDPQIDLPSLLSCGPLDARFIQPSWFEGLLTPSWVMWFSDRLARRVKDFPELRQKLARHTRFQIGEEPPWSISDSLYQRWVAAWSALKPLHLSASKIDEEWIKPFYTDRFESPSLADLRDGWGTHVSGLKLAYLERGQLRRSLFEAGRPMAKVEILDVAKRAENVLDPLEVASHVVPALVELISKGGGVAISEASRWLDYIEEHAQDWRWGQVLQDAAALATATNQIDRAFQLLGRRDLDASKVKKDLRLKALRKDKRFQALFK